jgi:hypothetical protein
VAFRQSGKRYLGVASAGAPPVHLWKESLTPFEMSPIGPAAALVAHPVQAGSADGARDIAICASGIATQPPKDNPRPQTRTSRRGEKRLIGMDWFLKGSAIRLALMPPWALTGGNRMRRNAFR